MSFLSDAIELPITNGFYESRSLQLSAQRCVNYFPVVHEQPCLSTQSLYMTPGIESLIQGLDGICRGIHEMNGKPYAVCGEKLYRIDLTVNPDLSETWAAVDLGTVSGSEPVIMSSGKTGNTFELVIVNPGVSIYHYIISTGTLSALDGVANFLSPAVDVCNVFGFFVFLQEGTNTIFHSNEKDAQTYNALDFFTVTQASEIVGLINFRENLFVFGSYKIIPFTYAGGSNFAFQSQFNAVKPYGLRGVYAKADLGSYLCFLGNRRNAEPSVFVYSGGEPQRISTEAIDKKLQALTVQELNNAQVGTYSQAGADFVYIIAGNESYFYNLGNGKWNEQRSYISSELKRWRVSAICQAYNYLLVGDFQSGLIGRLDTDITTEYSAPIPRHFITQAFDNKGKAIQVKDLLMFMDSGFGGSITLEWSDDGGVTWTTNAIERDAGATGEYGKMVTWNRMGSAPYFRALRFGTSTESKCNINKLYVKA